MRSRSKKFKGQTTKPADKTNSQKLIKYHGNNAKWLWQNGLNRHEQPRLLGARRTEQGM
jgi:hypothetical protein